MRIGVIAEEASDIDVLYELTCKLTKENMFSFKKFVGHGCGKLRRKCTAWAENLLRRGCSHLVIIHDLDDNDEAKLYAKLTGLVQNVGFDRCLILIPIHEIEAWLLSDSRALKNVFGMSKLPNVPGKPEAVINPKEKLRDIVWTTTKKRYLNTIHNKKIAAASRISRIKTCRSFQPYPLFLTTCKSI